MLHVILHIELELYMCEYVFLLDSNGQPWCCLCQVPRLCHVDCGHILLIFCVLSVHAVAVVS